MRLRNNRGSTIQWGPVHCDSWGSYINGEPIQSLSRVGLPCPCPHHRNKSEGKTYRSQPKRAASSRRYRPATRLGAPASTCRTQTQQCPRVACRSEARPLQCLPGDSKPKAGESYDRRQIRRFFHRTRATQGRELSVSTFYNQLFQIVSGYQIWGHNGPIARPVAASASERSLDSCVKPLRGGRTMVPISKSGRKFLATPAAFLGAGEGSI